MMDRFNFRIWNKQENKYLDGIFAVARSGRLIIDLNILQDYDDKSSDCIIEQCTGLKDKNGKLIYEGDIVRHSYSGKGVVSFGKYTGCFAAGWENIYVDLFGWYLDDYYEPDDCGRLRVNLDDSHSPITEEDASDFEIIGNVHEQAEQKDK